MSSTSNIAISNNQKSPLKTSNLNNATQSSINTSQSQSTYQPRFIKKKPQNIASIDSAQELPVGDYNNQQINNISLSQTQYQQLGQDQQKSQSFADTNIFYAQTNQQANKQKSIIDEDEQLINKMMEDLKRQKIQQQQLLHQQLLENQQKLDSQKQQKNINTNANQFIKIEEASNSSMSQQQQYQVESFNSSQDMINNQNQQVYQDASGYVSLQQQLYNKNEILNITQSPRKLQQQQQQVVQKQKLQQNIVNGNNQPFNNNQSFNNNQQNIQNSDQLTDNQQRDKSGMRVNENTSQSIDYEEIKRKKIDELKKVVMQENNQPFNTIQTSTSKSPNRISDKITFQQQKQNTTNINQQQYSTSPIKSNQQQPVQNLQNQKQTITRDKTPTKPVTIQNKQQQSNQVRQFPKYNPILENKSQKPQQQNFDTLQKQTSVSRNDLYSTNNQSNNTIQHNKTQNLIRNERDVSQKRTQLSKTISSNNMNERKRLPPSNAHSQKQLQSQQNLNKKSQPTLTQNSQHHSTNDIQSQNSNPIQLSEKTQQIYFKKLQKEVEVAIRDADLQEKGGIDIEEFKQCFYNLNYLPYMNPKNQIENRYNNDHNYSNTLRSLIIQEKEFVYNLWSVLNPQNNTMIDNAMLYDVLLLLIYNVKSNIPTTAGFLGEYLENHYQEEGINLNIMIGQKGSDYKNLIHNGNSLNAGSFDIDRDQEINSTLLNKYLAYNNLWSIERIAVEFKQIHANKVTYTQTLRQRSPSPLGSSKNLQLGILDPALNNKKFKPQVLNDHLSELTFSPNLSSQTKKIDQQLTQRLLQETQQLQGLKRDTSADHIVSRNLNNQSQQLNNKLSNNTTQQQQPMNRYELLFYRHHLAEQKIEKAKENLLHKELEECSFQPNVSRQTASQGMLGMLTTNNFSQSNNNKTYQNLKREANQIFQDLSQKIKNQKQKYEEKNKEEKELEECTFKPNLISTNTNRKNAQKPPEKIPKGYYEQINRMRKINEEKKALEEKQKKKETGENYEKLKQLPIKPPSFVEKQREKRKLLMYVDVNITPTKAGRIGIYEGDNIKDLAKNFQKAFQLNNSMLVLLMHQLEQHLINYKEKHGIVDDNKTTFPKLKSNSNTNNTPQHNNDDLDVLQQTFNNNNNGQNENGNFGDKSKNYNKQQNDQSDIISYQLNDEFNMPTFDQQRQNRSNNNQNDDDDENDMNVNLNDLNEQDDYYQQNQQDDDQFQNDEDYENEKLNEYVRQEIERYDRLERENQQKQMQMLIQNDNNTNNYQEINYNNDIDEDLNNYHQQIQNYQLPGFGQLEQSQKYQQNLQQEKQVQYVNYDDSFNQ